MRQFQLLSRCRRAGYHPIHGGTIGFLFSGQSFDFLLDSQIIHDEIDKVAGEASQ